MGFREQLAALKEIDIADLELSEVATWPLAARRTVLVLVAALTFLLGYSMLLSPAFDALGRAAQEEQRLRDELRTQAPYSAVLLSPALQDQQALLVERFEALLGQLPTETEVPALLDDISRVGMESGLKSPPSHFSQSSSTPITTPCPSPLRWRGLTTILGAS